MDSTEAAAEIDAPFIKEAPQPQGDGGLVAIKGALVAAIQDTSASVSTPVAIEFKKTAPRDMRGL